MKKDLINNLSLYFIALVITLIIIFLQTFIVYASDDFEIIKINEKSYKVFKFIATFLGIIIFCKYTMEKWHITATFLKYNSK